MHCMGLEMKKLLIAVAVIVLGAIGAHAADLPAPIYTKSTVPAEPVFNWSGFYVGGDIGGVSQHASGDSNFFQPGPLNPNPLALSSSSGSFIGGGHLGYNWQVSRAWVLGIEGDVQGLNATGTSCRRLDLSITGCTDLGRGFATIETQTKWLATVRGRLGWTFDRFMVYGTGGAAFGDVRTNVNFNCLISGCAASSLSLATSGSGGETRTGWVAGAGIEWAFTSNWTVRTEYLHADLGKATNTTFLQACYLGGPCGLSYSRDITYDMGRVGLSYKFGGPAAAR